VAAIGAGAVLYVAYRPLLAAEPSPYSPECAEGAFSGVHAEEFRNEPESSWAVLKIRAVRA